MTLPSAFRNPSTTQTSGRVSEVFEHISCYHGVKSLGLELAQKVLPIGLDAVEVANEHLVSKRGRKAGCNRIDLHGRHAMPTLGHHLRHQARRAAQLQYPTWLGAEQPEHHRP